GMGEENVALDPAEFVLFVLYRQKAEGNVNKIPDNMHKIDDEKQLSARLGYYDAYVADMLHKWHPPRAITAPMAQKLAYLSNTPPSLWRKKAYTEKDARNVSFDLAKDASDIAVPHTGSHTERRRRLNEEKDYDGRGIS